MRSSALSFTKKLFLAFVLICCAIRSDAALTSPNDKDERSAEVRVLADTSAIEVVFRNETIDFKNVTGITAEDMAAMFAIQKEWFESYFREQQGRRRRGLQTTMRDSHDITTEYEFVRQTAITGTDGRPGTQVSYIQKVGFLPSSARKLVQVDVNNINEVYALVISIYHDQTALTEFTRTLRQGVGSFSTLYGITKRYQFSPDTAPLPMMPPPASTPTMMNVPPPTPAAAPTMMNVPTPATAPTMMNVPPPTPAAVATTPSSTNVGIVLENETIDFKNVASIAAEDMDAMFAIKKEWFESYFRGVGRRRRELQTLRDSSDITTQYEFVAQTTSTGADGKPVTKVTYTQTVGFLPSSTRKLLEVDADDPNAVYELVISIYQDEPVLTEFALSLLENVGSFSTLEGISKVFDHMMNPTSPVPVPMPPAPTTMPPPTPIMARPPAPTTGPPPPPTTAPPPPPTAAAETPSPDVEILYDGETIDFINAESATPEDIEAMFGIMKAWFESYYREQPFRGRLRRRGLQGNNNRRRNSRDITTQFTFVKQSVTTNASGKPVNQVTYNQKIGFAPSSRRKRQRKLFEVNVDDSDAVYALVLNIYKDEAALQDLAMTLRMNVSSFSTLEGISKLFNHMMR